MTSRPASAAVAARDVLRGAARGSAVRANATGAQWRHGHPGFAERYRAIASRDARFDGQFVTAVASTGIYCRPSCPARTPRETGVAFFATSAAAHEAGYRACKRCLPEATPGSPEWDWRGDVAGRAMRLITDGVVDREGVAGLAARLGYSSRHLTRLLTAELGAGPLALARARRAQLARALIVGTPLPLSDVAFAAGFGSVRQFTDTVRDVFAVTPSELRDRARGSGVRGSGAAAITPVDTARSSSPFSPAPLIPVTLALPVRAPFDAPGMFAYLAARAIDGVEVAELDLAAERLRFARTVALPHGPAVIDVTATRPPSTPHVAWSLTLRLALSSLADVAVGVARARRMLDLDSDPVAVDEALARDPRLAPLVAATPGIRVPGTADPAELLVRTIVGQQISVAAARTHLGRLAAAAGEPVVTDVPGLDRLFPTPAAIAATLAEQSSAEQSTADPARPLRLPARQVNTVSRVTHALADGALALDVGDDPTTLAACLEALPGLGPWTAHYVAMRVTGTPDAWIPGDVALLAGARAAGVVPAELPRPAAFRLLAAAADAWAPWRSYAAAHLWRAALEGAPAHPEHRREDTP